MAEQSTAAEPAAQSSWCGTGTKVHPHNGHYDTWEFVFWTHEGPFNLNHTHTWRNNHHGYYHTQEWCGSDGH